MTNHPHRSTWRSGLAPPSPEEIRAHRLAAGMTLSEAATLAGLSSHSRWAEYESGVKRPGAALWELWLLRADLHPTLVLRKRRRSPRA